MAKDKSLKSDALKRKKLCSNDSEAHVEEMKESKEKKKRKRVDVEVSRTIHHHLTLTTIFCHDITKNHCFYLIQEAPVQIPQVTIEGDDKKLKKDKKRKKKQMAEQTTVKMLRFTSF